METANPIQNEQVVKANKRKEAIENIIKEYNSLESDIDKQSYLNAITEWYMREKTLLLNNKTSDIGANRYSNNTPYSRQ